MGLLLLASAFGCFPFPPGPDLCLPPFLPDPVFLSSRYGFSGQVLLSCTVFCVAERERPGEQAVCLAISSYLVLTADGVSHSVARQLCEVAAIITWFYSSENSLLQGLTAQVPPRASRRKGSLSNPGLPGPGACIFYLCAVQTDSHLPFLRLQFKGNALRMSSEEEPLF